MPGFEMTTAEREKKAAYMRDYYAKNPDKLHAKSLNRRGQRGYSISPEQYDEMLARQGGVCAICKQPEKAKHKGKVRRLSVDHNHKNGKVRSLLCSDCNRAIGMMGDDVDRLRAAIKYLKRF